MKTSRIVVIVLLVAVVAAIIIIRLSNGQSAKPAVSNQAPSTTTSPDRVKSTSGPNGDIHPSPSGTGQGSSNSLLGQ